MTGGARTVLGVFLSTLLAGSALAAQGRETILIQPGPIAPNYADVVAILDPQAAAIADALASAVEIGVLAKRDADAIAAFYAARGDQPVWIADGAFTPAALDLIARIKRAGEDGLDPADYALPWTEVGLYLDAREEKIARAELQLSQAVALYARQAYSGRVTPSEVSANLNYKLAPPAAGDVLSLVSASRRPGRHA